MSDGGQSGRTPAPDPRREPPRDPAPPPRDPVPPRPGAEDSLLGLVDRLSAILERSDITELEIGAGGTAISLRKPVAASSPEARSVVPAAPTSSPAVSAPAEPAPIHLSVKAPLTGLFYSSPAPGSAPYVRVGDAVAVGQVIGLIEAMKLFNEIKSDLAGRVVRIAAESGALVKAKQPLVEVEPL